LKEKNMHGVFFLRFNSKRKNKKKESPLCRHWHAYRQGRSEAECILPLSGMYANAYFCFPFFEVFAGAMP
jgi:hypothetical protein